MEIMSMSKRQASNYKPCKPTLMISIQDGQLQEYPFKERTNHITRSRYVDFLTFHFEKNDFEDIIIHCQEGVSRSHAVALFIAKYFMKNDKIYKSLLHQEGKVYGGNAYVYDKLIQYLDKQTQKKGQQ